MKYYRHHIQALRRLVLVQGHIGSLYNTNKKNKPGHMVKTRHISEALSAEGQQQGEASVLSAWCSSAPICCLVEHEHYVCSDCITAAARPVSLCSAAAWRFKDLGLVLRNLFTILA